jgi:hypothetical protein
MKKLLGCMIRPRDLSNVAGMKWMIPFNKWQTKMNG